MFGGRVQPINRGRSKGNRRDIWRWVCGTSETRKTLEMLTPYLVTKRAEALLALKYFDIKLAKPSRRGRPAVQTAALDTLDEALRKAKRYEWKHGAILKSQQAF
jgi:hypothetical protein